VSPRLKRKRPSSYRLMATLRSRHLWTLWLLRRKRKRLAREQKRLHLLTELGAEQLRLVRRLERELPPEHQPPPPLLVTEPVQEIPAQPEQQYPYPIGPEPPPTPEEEPSPDPVAEIGLLLGPPPQRTTSRSSASSAPR
jgi:hypothetical protein